MQYCDKENISFDEDKTTKEELLELIRKHLEKNKKKEEKQNVSLFNATQKYNSSKQSLEQFLTSTLVWVNEDTSLNKINESIPTQKWKETLTSQRTKISQQRRFPVLVCGATSSGKSSFLNFLLNNDILPAQKLACTSAICEIRYGDEKQFWVKTIHQESSQNNGGIGISSNGLGSKNEKEQGNEIVDQKKTSKVSEKEMKEGNGSEVKNKKVQENKIEVQTSASEKETKDAKINEFEELQNQGYTKISVDFDKPEDVREKVHPFLMSEDRMKASYIVVLFWPSEFLKNGIILVDTPGINENNVLDELVNNYSKIVTGIICLTDIAQIPNTTVEFLRDLPVSKTSGAEKRLFLLCTKWDLLSPAEVKKAKKNIADRLQAEKGKLKFVKENMLLLNIQRARLCQKLGVRYDDDCNQVIESLNRFLGDVFLVDLQQSCIECEIIVERHIKPIFNYICCFNDYQFIEQIKKSFNELLQKAQEIQRENKNMANSKKNQLIDQCILWVNSEKENLIQEMSKLEGDPDSVEFNSKLQRTFEARLGEYVCRQYNADAALELVQKKYDKVLQKLQEEKKKIHQIAGLLPIDPRTESSKWMLIFWGGGALALVGGAIALPEVTLLAAYVVVNILLTVGIEKISIRVGKFFSSSDLIKRKQKAVKDFLELDKLDNTKMNLKIRKIVNKQLHSIESQISTFESEIVNEIQANLTAIEYGEKKWLNKPELRSVVFGMKSVLENLMSNLVKARLVCHRTMIQPDDIIEFGEELGRGSTGRVLAAKYKQIEKIEDDIGSGNQVVKIIDVAIKEIKLNNSIFPFYRFEIEESNLCNLRHENIIKYYGSCTTYDSLCLVLERARCSVYEMIHIKKEDYSWQYIALQTIRALEFLHTKEFVHRDVKSQNLLMMKDNSVKLADFGFTKSLNSNLTTKVGTEGYVPPEIKNPTPIGQTEKLDIYCFGVLVWELITRNHPSQFQLQLLDQQGIESKWRVLIKDCCQTDPSKRPKASDIIFSLDETIRD